MDVESKVPIFTVDIEEYPGLFVYKGSAVSFEAALQAARELTPTGFRWKIYGMYHSSPDTIWDGNGLSSGYSKTSFDNFGLSKTVEIPA